MLKDGTVWSQKALTLGWKKVRGELAGGIGKTASQLRESLGLPRRHAIVLLEYFDQLGWTQRMEDDRVPGPNFDAANGQGAKKA
jgi:hypothetical protein